MWEGGNGVGTVEVSGTAPFVFSSVSFPFRTAGGTRAGAGEGSAVGGSGV